MLAAVLLLLTSSNVVLLAQNLGAAPQTNVAVQGQTGAQPEGAFLNLVNWVGNVIAPVGAALAIAAGLVSFISGRGVVRYVVTALGCLAVSGVTRLLESAGHKVRRVADLAPKAPTFSAVAVTNGASFRPSGIQAGSIATIFGTFLANVAGAVTDGGVFPLPTNLNGTTVTVGGILAPPYMPDTLYGGFSICHTTPCILGDPNQRRKHSRNEFRSL